MGSSCGTSDESRSFWRGNVNGGTSSIAQSASSQRHHHHCSLLSCKTSHIPIVTLSLMCYKQNHQDCHYYIYLWWQHSSVVNTAARIEPRDCLRVNHLDSQPSHRAQLSLAIRPRIDIMCVVIVTATTSKETVSSA